MKRVFLLLASPLTLSPSPPSLDVEEDGETKGYVALQRSNKKIRSGEGGRCKDRQRHWGEGEHSREQRPKKQPVSTAQRWRTANPF